MSKVKTHYDNLKVARDAPMEVIKAAYKSLALKYHPDRNGNSPESQNAMRCINSAYSALSDPEQRRQHDEWIARMEGGSPNPPSPPSPPNESPSHITKRLKRGKIRLASLDQDTKKALLGRIPTRDGPQFGVPLDGVNKHYAFVVAVIIWFVYVFINAFDHQWNGVTRDWYGAITFVAAIILGYCVSYLVAWHKSPFKSWLLVSPLYIIKTGIKEVRFWPRFSVSGIEATHNHRNGVYQDTSLRVWFDGKLETFIIRPSSAYANFIGKFKQYDAEVQGALSRGDGEYFAKNDYFASLTGSGEAEWRLFDARSLALHAVVFAVCSAAFLAAWSINLRQPSMAITRPVVAQSPSQRSELPRVNYVRPSLAPNGSPWPSNSALIKGYAYLRANGLSSVTVDNSNNDSDVFVRLVYLHEAIVIPIRSIFIKQGDKFEIKKIEPGRYDVRYQDLGSGLLSRSESFTLEETPTASGTQSDHVTMTLFKVQDGNMRTYTISPEEFL